jgi:hypothetical protein
MGKSGRPFTLYTRPRKRGKPVYYVRYKNPRGGWTVAQSTGQTSEGAAETYALEQLQTGAVASTAEVVPSIAHRGFPGRGASSACLSGNDSGSSESTQENLRFSPSGRDSSSNGGVRRRRVCPGRPVSRKAPDSICPSSPGTALGRRARVTGSPSFPYRRRPGDR